MADPLFCDWPNEERIMAGWRRAVELTMTDEEIERLTVLSRSRTEPASQVSRAQMLLAYRENPSFFAVGKRIGVYHQTVQRCVERAGSGHGVQDPQRRPTSTRPHLCPQILLTFSSPAGRHYSPPRTITAPLSISQILVARPQHLVGTASQSTETSNNPSVPLISFQSSS